MTAGTMNWGAVVPLTLLVTMIGMVRRRAVERSLSWFSPPSDSVGCFRAGNLGCLMWTMQTYSTINPVVCPVAALFFVLSFVTWRCGAAVLLFLARSWFGPTVWFVAGAHVDAFGAA